MTLFRLARQVVSNTHSARQIKRLSPRLRHGACILVRLLRDSPWRASSQAKAKAFTRPPLWWWKVVIGGALSLLLVTGGLVRSYAQAHQNASAVPSGTRKTMRPGGRIFFGIPDSNYENAPVVVTSCGVVFTNHPGAKYTSYIAKLTFLNRRGAMVKNVHAGYEFISFSSRFQRDSVVTGSTLIDTDDLQSYELREVTQRVDEDPPGEETDTDGMTCEIRSIELSSGQVIEYPAPLHL